MTKKWVEWGSSDKEEEEMVSEEEEKELKERIKGLAKLTKGYGGANLRVCLTIYLLSV